MKPYTRRDVETPDAEVPVTLAQVKFQLRLEADDDLDDDLLLAYLAAARHRAEEFCNQVFAPRQVDVLFEGAIPAAGLALPYRAGSVDAVVYYDSAGAEFTVPEGDYFLDPVSAKVIAPGGWPSGAISHYVRFQALPPEDLSGVVVAMLLMCADLYDTRTENIVGSIVQTSPAVEANLYPYRRGLGI